jgi:hypothetical protein
MRYLALTVALALLAGCADPVVVQNPKSGEKLLCKTPASEWNPWSQDDACVAEHIAEGWTIAK